MKKQTNIILLIGIVVAVIFLVPQLSKQTSTLFSIAGQGWGCSNNPDNEYILQPNQGFAISDISFDCPSGKGLIDTFVDWNPKIEYKNTLPQFNCPSSASECQVQIYCCNHFDCSSDTDCKNWFGSGYTCISGGNDPLIDFNWASWKYCKKTADVDVKCWGVINNQCKYALYSQSYLDNNFDGSCSGLEGTNPYFYNSEAECKENICTPSCSGKSCGDNGCGGSCGNCPSGQSCINGGCTGDCPSGQVKCSDGVCRTICGTPNCKNKEEIFYSNGYYTYGGGGLSTISGEITSSNIGTIEKYITGFTAKYRESKDTACCSDLDYSFVDSKTFNYDCGTWDITCVRSIQVDYDQYKCVEEGTTGFCLEFAHSFLNKYTHTDDCQTNTIILIVGALLLIILIAGLIK